MTVEGRNISGAPTLMPRIICSSLPSWLEWKTLISTLPFSSAFALLANSSAVSANSDPGKPTWPRRSVTCAEAGMLDASKAMIAIRNTALVFSRMTRPFRRGRAALVLQARRSFQNPPRPGCVEHPAGAEARHIAGRLLGRPAALLDPIDHFLREVGGDHSMAAHRRKLERRCVRQPIDATAKTERVLHAVARDAGVLAAALRLVHRRANVDRDSQLRLLEIFHERFHGLVVVEH